jgi:hypothetical protein
MRQAVLVAPAATLVAHHFEVAVLGRLHSVGGVAIRADWPALVAFQQQLSVNAFVVRLFNCHVTFAASLATLA